MTHTGSGPGRGTRGGRGPVATGATASCPRGARSLPLICLRLATALVMAGGAAIWGMTSPRGATGAAPATLTAYSAPAVPAHASKKRTRKKPHTTRAVIDGSRAAAVYQGVGAISGGGGNSRYLIDYPEPERSQILNYLFTPHYGASLQLLKLEIGGDSNSSDGSEASIEHTKGTINCNAGYEWWIAEQAVRRNPGIKLYGLQWGAPGWTAGSPGTLWSKQDVNYVIDWLNCAKSHGLTISYLGGRDEAGFSAAWYERLRAALDKHGYGNVQIVAADENTPNRWTVGGAIASDPALRRAVSIVGSHDTCGPGQYSCQVPKLVQDLHKPVWLAEQGGIAPNRSAGEARAINLMYIQGGMTALLEWPLLNSMPPGLPYEDRGLVTADQPWSGTYSVNMQTWVTAQTTQFVAPGWVHVAGANQLLGNSGSYDTYMAPGHSAWSLVAENTGLHRGQKVSAQRISVTVTGGLQAKVVHVWATDTRAAQPSKWFVREHDITPVHGKFTYLIPPGYVVTFTTTSGQRKGTAPAPPRPHTLALPYFNSLTGNDGSDEPPLLAPLDGAFGPQPCLGGLPGACLQQLTPQAPVLWHSKGLDYPYAIIGDPAWSNYTVSVDVLMTQATGTAGIIGRFTERASNANTPGVGNSVGLFKGYMLSVSDNGDWSLLRNRVWRATPKVLATGLVSPLGLDTWHTLALRMYGDRITAIIDGRAVATVTSSQYPSGLAGIASGAFTGTWPIDQYRDLSVTPVWDRITARPEGSAPAPTPAAALASGLPLQILPGGPRHARGAL